MALKFLHLNIEGRKHIDKICAFLESNDFDVLCFQEICSDTVIFLKEKFGFADHVFVNMGFYPKEDSERGLSIISKHPIKSSKEKFLKKSDDRYVKDFSISFFTLKTEIEVNNSKYNFITTHLPVNYPGNVISDFQKECYENLKDELSENNSFILTGDFNAPRGTSIFDDLAKRYKDNIPREIISTIDPILHRAPGLNFVVDGVFSTDDYVVNNILIHEGLSDHKGISGILTVS